MLIHILYEDLDLKTLQNVYMSAIDVFINVYLFQGAESSGILEIHFLEYKNTHERSHKGEKCPLFNRRENRCTDIFKVTLASKLFSETLTTKAFQEDAGMVTFGNVLNDVISNPWKIKLQKIEVEYSVLFILILVTILTSQFFFLTGMSLRMSHIEKDYLKSSTYLLRAREFCQR